MKAVLVLNAGSSSLKFALFPLEPTLATKPALSGQIEGIGATPELSAKDANGERFHEPVATLGEQSEQHRDALNHLFHWLAAHNPDLEIAAAGHRVVHGGDLYSAPVKLSEALLRELDTFVPLAPLHQPHNLRAVRAVATLMPAVPQVACFDTAFHRTQPAVAQAFALPRAITAEGVKRYGFHGLSYDYVARQLPDIIGERAHGSVVIAHLGIHETSAVCAQTQILERDASASLRTALHDADVSASERHGANLGRCKIILGDRIVDAVGPDCDVDRIADNRER
ncbi:MAG: hypothetical protein CVU25_05265, partial [Betaproteobacteria bacterium HGW-Betaproteobacteria-19]